MKSGSRYVLILCALLLVGQGCTVPDVTQEAAGAGLIKASGPAVYYRTGEGARFAFPNEKVYFSWYPDFSNIETLSDAELADIPLSGNVTYKPGVRLVKVATDPKVYAVGANGLLRWVTSETLASKLYGSSWAKNVHDIPDAFFPDYHVGDPITARSEYEPLAPYYTGMRFDGGHQVIDISELPDDLPLYPSGTLTGAMMLSGADAGSSPTGEQATVIYDYALQGVSDASSTVLAWFDASLSKNGWKKKTNNLLYQLLNLQGMRSYTKDANANTEKSITVLPIEDSLLVYYGIGPKAPPFPDIVPVYPSADALVKNQNEDQRTALYIAYTLDPTMNVFTWYQGQLAKYSWTEVRNEDKDADMVRIYERPVGNRLYGLKLTVSALRPQEQISNYTTGIIVMYGPSDRPEFQPGSKDDPFMYLFQRSTVTP